MLGQSKVDAMNDALADYIIKRVETLSPLATEEELSSLAQLARVVNDAPKTIQMIGEPIRPHKRKRRS